MSDKNRLRATVANLAVLTLSFLSASAHSAVSRDKLVVSTGWLQQHLNDKDLVILHVGDKKEYDAGHIVGARHGGTETFTVNGKLTLELPASQTLHQHLQALGLDDNSRIVVYFVDDEFPSATRALVTLDAAGLGERVALLDGGLRAWQRDGHALTQKATPVTPSKLEPLKMRPLIVDAAFVQEKLKTTGYKIIDARAPVYYDGVQAGMGQAPANLKGHLPGATNIPFTSVTDTALSLKSADELAALFKAAGVSKGDQVIAYCHIGYQGTAVVFAARSLGIDAVLYDGSFQDWARRGLPVELSTSSKAE